MPFHFLGVFLIDLGLVVVLVGAIGLVRPVARLGVPSRRVAFGVLAGGVGLALLGIGLPAPATTVETPSTELDRFIPTYQFVERHERRMAAPPARVYESIRTVTAGEITLFRVLTTIRRFGRPGPESLLNAPEDRPILDVATGTTFWRLAEEPLRELVVGTLVSTPDGFVRPEQASAAWLRGLSGPGYATAVMNFTVRPADTGTLVTTETRVFASDARTRRRFAAYWRLIYPGSALIRRMWLRAIERRALREDRPERSTPGRASG